MEQAVVVSRMPTCLRRHDIKSGVTGSVKMEVFEAGDYLWALKQGKSWYLAGTEKCEFQRWKDAPRRAPRQAGRHLHPQERQARIRPRRKGPVPIRPAGE